MYAGRLGPFGFMETLQPWITSQYWKKFVTEATLNKSNSVEYLGSAQDWCKWTPTMEELGHAAIEFY